MTNGSSDSTRGLSLLLSTLMVLSMVAVGTAALGGTAAAQQSDPITVYDGSGNQAGTYSSLDAAVDNASEGYRIVLSAGDYDLTSTIDTPGLTIEGPNAGVPATSDQRASEANVTFGGDITADNVTIDGVHFESDSGKLRTSGAHTTFENTVVDVPSSDAPIWLEAGADNAVIDNNVFDGSGGGFVIHTRPDATPLIDGVEITNNVFRNADDGVVQAKGLTNAQISGNNFTDIAADAIRLAGNVTGTSVTDNVIRNTGTNPDNALTTGIFLNAVEGEVEISGNEFANNPYHIAAYGDSEVPAIGNNEYDQRVAVDNTTVADGYVAGELQAAIDFAADGANVTPTAGTYDETVTVSTANLTLVGPNAGVPGDGDRSAEATINGQLIVEASGVTVDGFDISPPNATSNQNAEALRVSNSADDVVVKNNVVRDFGEDGVAEWEGVDAINVFGGSGSDAVENVTITDNLIDGISGRDTKGGTAGVSIQGNVVNVAVTDNTITNVGQEETAWAFGVVVRGTGNHDVTPTGVMVVDNEISDVRSNPATDTVGVGVGLEGGYASDVEFAENEISNAGYLIEDKTETVDLNQFIASNTIDRGALLAEGGNTIYGNVQGAVDAANSGETVRLLPGTYEGSFDVSTNNVTIVGTDGADETTLDIGTERINVPADNVTVYGVSVVFENQGMYVRGDDVSVVNSTFELAEGVESNGYGIRFEGLTSDGLVYNSEFVGINNTVEGEYGNGIVVSGPDDHHIVKNTFSNNSIGVNVGGQQPAERLYVGNNTFTGQGTAAIALNHDASGSPQFDISDNRIASNDVGVLVLSGGSIHVNGNDIVDNGVAIRSLTDETVFADRNWWGTESGPAADAVEGDVYTNPHLTVPTAEAADTSENLTEFGFTVEMDAGAHAFGVPGPVEGTVGSVFNEFNGTVYAYADGSWTQVTDADRELSALDALLVVPEEGETARASIEIAEGSGAAAPSSKRLDEGWNFVGAPQAGAIETAYGASSADPARALNLYDEPTVGDSSVESDWTKYTFGTDTNGPDVSPVSGYWVYAEEDGSVAANVPTGVTLEEFSELTAPSEPIALAE